MKNKKFLFIRWGNRLQHLHLLFAIFLFFALQGLFSCSNPVKNEMNRGIAIDTLQYHWQIQNSKSLKAGGKKISTKAFNVGNWYSAKVPTTVLNVLVQHGVYKDIFQDENLRKIPKKQFRTSWWYRTSFRIANKKDVYILKFQGINYKANIWLNGILLSDTSSINNAFKQYSFDVTTYLVKGENVLALNVFPPKAGDYTIGSVDWNPAPPDRDMGIFRPVILYRNGGVEISEPFVESILKKDNSVADLIVTLRLSNHLQDVVTGTLHMKVAGKIIQKKISLKAGETVILHFSSKNYPKLRVDKPKLWWPYTMGTPHLYHAEFSFLDGGKVLDNKLIDFGIRTVSSYFTKQGFRGFKINGKKILIRGGGWTDRMLLDDTPESIKDQFEYVKNMGLNTIRLEGFWGNSQAMYNLADRMGILIMVGWSCQWEWEEYLHKPVSKVYGGILSPSDVDMMSKAWQDQIVWLRNHPSIFVWLYGSDKMPEPALEKKYLKIRSEYDSSRVYLASAHECTSLAGPTGVKMRGPYAYEPPVYWFSDTLYGGAFGFNTETGPGAQVPPLESIEKMISKKYLWPIDSVWNYHCAHHKFSTLNRYTKALEARYGKATSVEDYAKKAQVLNYELMRPMFEAFSAHRYKATGVIQWMLNSAWPSMYWQLYDYYLMPNGAYYGAQEANRPVHALYDYSKNAIYLVNDKLENINNLSLKIKILNVQSKIIFEKSMSVNIKANISRELFQLPDNLPLSKTYFLDLQLFNTQKREIDNNFYWLSTKKDILNYKATTWFHTPSKQYADFTALNTLPKVIVAAKIIRKVKGQENTVFTVKLKNNSKYIAFFEHAALVNKSDRQTILPVLWSDNDVSLLPGEIRILTATIHRKDLKNKEPQLVVKGYNE